MTNRWMISLVGSISGAGLVVSLYGNADARSCVPAAFSARMSPFPDESGDAGPLTVARLFLTLLCFCGVFRRDDLAMRDPGVSDGVAVG